MKTAGLSSLLESGGQFTIFAPTDKAFKELPNAFHEMLSKQQNGEAMVNLVTAHVTPMIIRAQDVYEGEIPTISSRPLIIKIENGQPTISGTKIVQADIPANNGIIHVIDKVILPTALANSKE